MKRIAAILSLLPAFLVYGCGSTVPGSDAYLRRDVENLALRVRHLEDRLTEVDDSMGGLAQKAFSGTDSASDDFSGSSYSMTSGVSESLPASYGSDTARDKWSFTHMVQDALRHAGYDPGPVDGKMGTQTANALRQFQRDKGLQVTGSTTKATWRMLAKYSAK